VSSFLTAHQHIIGYSVPCKLLALTRDTKLTLTNHNQSINKTVEIWQNAKPTIYKYIHKSKQYEKIEHWIIRADNVNSAKVRGYKLVSVFVEHTGLKNCIKQDEKFCLEVSLCKSIIWYGTFHQAKCYRRTWCGFLSTFSKRSSSAQSTSLARVSSSFEQRPVCLVCWKTVSSGSVAPPSTRCIRQFSYNNSSGHDIQWVMCHARAVASRKALRGHMQRAVGHLAGVSSQCSQSYGTGVQVAPWHSGKVVWCIIKVTLCQARLVLR